MIRDLVRKGLTREPEQTSPDIVRVVVTPRFLSLDFDQKQAFMGVVYAYYFSSTDDKNQVIIQDSKSNKAVGKFSSLRAGLEMY